MITKKQHIVPCSFLAHFSDNPTLNRKAPIWTYNKDKKEYKEASVESIFYENNIYTVQIGKHKNDFMEKYFGAIESQCMPYINKFIQRGGFLYNNTESNSPLEDENAYIQQFLIFLLMRQPEYVKRLTLHEKELFENTIKGFLYANNFEKNFNKDLIDNYQTRDLLSFKSIGGDFIFNDNYITKLDFQKIAASPSQELVDEAWKAGYLNTSSDFNEFCDEYNKKLDHEVKSKSRRYGPALKFCPVSPQLAIGLAHKTLDPVHKENYGRSTFRMEPREYSEKGVKMINQRTLQQARHFIYAKDRETLEKAVDLEDAEFEVAN